MLPRHCPKQFSLLYELKSWSAYQIREKRAVRGHHQLQNKILVTAIRNWASTINPDKGNTSADHNGGTITSNYWSDVPHKQTSNFCNSHWRSRGMMVGFYGVFQMVHYSIRVVIKGVQLYRTAGRFMSILGYFLKTFTMWTFHHNYRGRYCRPIMNEKL